MVKKRKAAQETPEITVEAVVEGTASESDLGHRLEEIRNCEGIIGYILRDTSTASIDLNDPEKTVEYAILSSSAFDAGKDLSQIFDLGNIENSIYNGRKIQMLSTNVGENRISIFADKGTDLEKILTKLQA